MKRRNFLTMIGAATLAPALHSLGGTPVATAAAGYNRYMYGLGVFQARTRAGLTTVELMTRLKLNKVQAEAMIGEMTASGVFSPITSAVRVATTKTTPRKPYVRKAMRQVEAWLDEQPDTAQQKCPTCLAEITTETDTANSTPPVCTCGVHVVHSV